MEEIKKLLEQKLEWVDITIKNGFEVKNHIIDNIIHSLEEIKD